MADTDSVWNALPNAALLWKRLRIWLRICSIPVTFIIPITKSKWQNKISISSCYFNNKKGIWKYLKYFLPGKRKMMAVLIWWEPIAEGGIGRSRFTKKTSHFTSFLVHHVSRHCACWLKSHISYIVKLKKSIIFSRVAITETINLMESRFTRKKTLSNVSRQRKEMKGSKLLSKHVRVLRGIKQPCHGFCQKCVKLRLTKITEAATEMVTLSFKISFVFGLAKEPAY